VEDETTRKSTTRPVAKQDKVHREKQQSPRQRARQIEDDVMTTEEDIAPPENAIAKEGLPFKKSGMRCC
jgi:hypothetical protein